MSSKKKKLSAVIAVACIIVLLLGIIAAAFFWKEKDPEHNHGTTEPTQGMTEPSGDATEPTGTEPTTGSEPTGPDGTEPSDPTDPVGPTDPTESSPTTPTELPHKHDYQVQETVAPSCTDKGYTVYVCDCGDSYTRDIDKLDHNYTSKVIAPTCTEKGYTSHTCICGRNYRDNEVKAAGHAWGAWTDSGNGESFRQCDVCGKQESKKTSSPVYYCEYCGRVCGDGSNGTCIHWMTGGNHTCPSCGATVPGNTCHTCPDD